MRADTPRICVRARAQSIDNLGKQLSIEETESLKEISPFHYDESNFLRKI